MQQVDEKGRDLSNVTDAMNRMYRWTRFVYNASRKYYLLGRDRLIRELGAKPGEVVIEVGCGTARNLIKMARRYPGVMFYGLDASEEMLKTAREDVARAGLSNRIKLAHGFAQNFDPIALFALPAASIDKIVFSYALSMIPPWKESIDHALAVIKPSGEIHIVDFGDQGGLPPWFRKFLFWWLDIFGVHFRPELPPYILGLYQKGLHPETTFGMKGYYFLSRIRG
jgi:S-adenosylmethionine-diacylgycerolhomoserine-N-methlytransferase